MTTSNLENLIRDFQAIKDLGDWIFPPSYPTQIAETQLNFEWRVEIPISNLPQLPREIEEFEDRVKEFKFVELLSVSALPLQPNSRTYKFVFRQSKKL